MPRVTLVAFLFCFMAINFADKAVLGFAAPQIMRELHLSHAAFGAIGSSFFALFSLSALGAGWLGDRTNPRRLLAAMALVWSAAQLAAGIAGSAGLVASRVLLGAGEGPAFPTASLTAYDGTTGSQRPLVTGIILAGAPFGTGLAALACTAIALHYGWRAAFMTLGVTSLVWAFAWTLAGGAKRDVVSREVRQTERPLSLRALLGNRASLGVSLASFASYLSNAVALVWFPKFLEAGAGFSEAAAGSLLALGAALQIPVCIFGGWAVARLGRRARFRGDAYAWVATGAVAVAGLALAALTFAGGGAAPACFIIVSLIAAAVVFIVSGPLIAEIVPQTQRGTALGTLVATYALGGLIGPALFGGIVDAASTPLAGYRLGFLIAGGGMFLAAACARVLIRPGLGRAGAPAGSVATRAASRSTCRRPACASSRNFCALGAKVSRRRRRVCRITGGAARRVCGAKKSRCSRVSVSPGIRSSRWRTRSRFRPPP